MKINPKPDTDILELIYFCTLNEKFITKEIHTFRLIKSEEIRYVLYEAKLYILAHMDNKNYFFTVDLYEVKVVEEIKISSEVGFAPTLCLIENNFILAIGGLNSNTINIFDIRDDQWIYIGKMQTTRYGAYVLYDEKDKNVYISGGRDNDMDNTLDIEYFSINDLNKIEIKVKAFNSGFSLRRSFPIVFQLTDSKTFIVCGGSGLFLDEDTNTSTVVSVTDQSCYLMADLHQEFSSKNPNVAIYKSFVYFFIKNNEVVKYNMQENTFNSILRDEEEEKR